MPRGLKFKRRIRVVVGGQIVTNDDPALPAAINEERSLDVVFSTESHVKLEPLMTELTVFGLNLLERTKLTTTQDTAAKQSWKAVQALQSGAVLIEDSTLVTQFQQQLVTAGPIVTIEAGYDGDFGLLAKAQTVPEGIKHKWADGGWVTTIRAQDTRYPWQSSFTSEEVAPGVRLSDMQALLQLSEGFLVGDVDRATIAAAEPSLLETKNFGGYLNGRVLQGDTRDFETEIADRLGYRRYSDRGQLKFLNAASATLDEAVLLQQVPKRDLGLPVPGGMQSYEVSKRGFVEATALIDHRIFAGRQVVLQDALGAPIAGGLFRVDYCRHAGSNFSAGYNTLMRLRPVTINPALNV